MIDKIFGIIPNHLATHMILFPNFDTAFLQLGDYIAIACKNNSINAHFSTKNLFQMCLFQMTFKYASNDI